MWVLLSMFVSVYRCIFSSPVCWPGPVAMSTLECSDQIWLLDVLLDKKNQSSSEK